MPRTRILPRRSAGDRYAEIEAHIAQQLDLIRRLATRGEDTSQAEKQLWALRQAWDTLVEQHDPNAQRGSGAP